MNYSQNLEQQYILDYFKDTATGRYLEIGSFHPTIFSNTRALFEKGFSGILVEPSPICMSRLREEYENEPRITLIEAAVSNFDGVIDFKEEVNGAAVGSTDEKHVEKWSRDENFKFNNIKVKSISVDTLLKEHGQNIDFLSLDVEGINYEIFQMIPDSFFERLKCICIEHDDKYNEIEQKLITFGFSKVYFNAENLIMVKNG